MEERTIRGGKKGQQTAQKNRINEEITAQEVRLIDIDGEQAGIQSLKDAQAMADAAGVDLVEISPNAEPPVCKVMDYLRKFLEAGDKAKITIRFRGREMAHQEIGIELLNRVKGDLEDLAVVESFPNRVEGRQMVMMMAPIAKK